MFAEIIIVGDEILIGQTIDTNTGWLAEQLHRIGVRLREVHTISDQREAILRAVDKSMVDAELTIITGGLGPTQDDITKETLAEYFDMPLVRNEAVLKYIEDFFASRDLRMPEMNLTQADLPQGAKILHNSKGTAQGMWFERGGRVVLSIPGVPYEMKAIMRESGLAMISKKFNSTPIIHKTVLTQGIGESFLAEKLSDWESALRNDRIFLAYLPSTGRVRLRLTAYPDKNNVEIMEAKMERYIDELFRRIPKYAYGRGEETLAAVVGDMLRQGGLTVSTAESCTGGYLAHLITAEPRSSECFIGGSVTYSEKAKMSQIGVPEDLMETYGVVSEEVVRAMAEGARKTFGSDFALATTGIAGPDGGTPEHPVGTIWTAVASASSTQTKLLHLGENRSRNIEKASLSLLNMLRNIILKSGLVE